MPKPKYIAIPLTSSKHKPTLSACLIIKNAAATLEACLESLQAITHEIIVVDTGSSDTSLEIAQRYTDKIFFYPWCDDFATARNESLKHATGDWVLIIDADETLPTHSHQPLLDYITHTPKTQLQGIAFRAISEQGPDIWTRALFPNHQGIYFKGRVHEQLYHQEKLLPVVLVPTLEFLHFNKNNASTLDKQRYYISLIEKELREVDDPCQKAVYLYHLAESQHALRRFSTAIEYLHQAHILLNHNSPESLLSTQVRRRLKQWGSTHTIKNQPALYSLKKWLSLASITLTLVACQPVPNQNPVVNSSAHQSRQANSSPLLRWANQVILKQESYKSGFRITFAEYLGPCEGPANGIIYGNYCFNVNATSYKTWRVDVGENAFCVDAACIEYCSSAMYASIETGSCECLDSTKDKVWDPDNNVYICEEPKPISLNIFGTTTISPRDINGAYDGFSIQVTKQGSWILNIIPELDGGSTLRFMGDDDKSFVWNGWSNEDAPHQKTCFMDGRYRLEMEGTDKKVEFAVDNTPPQIDQVEVQEFPISGESLLEDPYQMPAQTLLSFIIIDPKVNQFAADIGSNEAQLGLEITRQGPEYEGETMQQQVEMSSLGDRRIARVTLILPGHWADQRILVTSRDLVSNQATRVLDAQTYPLPTP